MFVVEPLHPERAEEYRRFTYPWLRENLAKYCSQDDRVVLAASYFSKPAGLIVARLDPSNSCGNIQSIFVVSAYRQKGLGTDLLRATEDEIRARGCKSLTIYFPMDEKPVSPMSRIIEKSGWSSPVKNDEVSKFPISTFTWMHRLYFKSGERTVPWEELSPTQLKAVQEGVDDWYPSRVSPFQPQLQEYHPKASFWLTRGDQILGWVVTVPVAKDTLSYERLYIRKDLQKTGLGIKLLAHTFKAQLSLGIPFGSAMINYNASVVNLPLLRFYEKRVKPYIVLCKEYYLTKKKLDKNKNTKLIKGDI